MCTGTSETLYMLESNIVETKISHIACIDLKTILLLNQFMIILFKEKKINICPAILYFHKRTYELYLPASLPSTARLETPSHPVEDCDVGLLYARFTRLSSDRAFGSDSTWNRISL